MNNLPVVIVEDEPELAQLLAEYIGASGYSYKVINHGLEASAWLRENESALVLLDLMLPGKDGLEICKEIRKHSQVPIIMVTAKVEEVDRLLGLEIGADDYICKPYSPREVVARVKAVLRRTEASAQGIKSENDLYLDEDKHIVIANNKTIELTTIEFRLFKLMYNTPGKIFSRQYLMDNIYSDYRIVSDRTVDSHIKKLRKKLQPALEDEEVIRSVYGAGYKYEPVHE